ncbi:response regulator transcription factor [Chryseobacterium sp. FH1]|uniref:response regulator transcription factor n=1 Tax=Chryseobacterium sp. FH1 TaxID=1233951 RepID=UPI000975C957|nr:response regulator transcription factor [Chryseobacterium sp. FH1]
MKTNIAIADHHRIFRRSLVGYMERHSDIHIIFEASESSDLMQKLSEYKEVQVVLLELQSAEMDGFNCWKTINKNYPDIRIIILSHLRGSHYLKYALQSQILGYFTKDSDPIDLLKAIRGANSGEFYYDIILKQDVAQITKYLNQNLDDHLNSAHFSPRELEIIYWSARELKSKEIAEKLNISYRTVEGHKNNLIKKTGCKTFLGIILLALDLNMISKELI